MPEYRNYLLEYCHEGSRWSLTIPATSEEDAAARARQIYYARVLGTLEMEIPAQLGLFARMFYMVRNLFGRW